MEEKFMQIALDFVSENIPLNKGGPFGAIIVKNGEIIGRGVNCVTSLNNPICHAEIMAIQDACKNINNYSLEGCDIYSTCEPCPMCLCAIYWARLDRLIYSANRFDAAKIGFDDQCFYDEMDKPMEEKKLKIKSLESLRHEAVEVFRTWHEKSDKILY